MIFFSECRYDSLTHNGDTYCLVSARKYKERQRSTNYLDGEKECQLLGGSIANIQNKDQFDMFVLLRNKLKSGNDNGPVS